MSQSSKFKSHFDPSRETVGKIAQDAALSADGYPIEVGDMKGAILPDLVNDINHALCTPSEKCFYLLVTEKKDLQIKNAIARTLKHLDYRPWPEDNTTVFWKNPKTQELRFCWDIPHWSEMDNILANPFLWDIELVRTVDAWKKFDLSYFGFYYHPKFKWIPTNPIDKPNEKDKRLDSNSTFSSNGLVSSA